MTREEKINKILDELRDDFIKVNLPLMETMTLFAKVQNAVYYAANLSTESCEDAISRQAVLSYIERILNQGTGKKKSFAFIKKYVEKQPSVTSETKMGHWITTRSLIHDGEYYCDKCKCDSPNNEKWDYCPNCGTRMKKEKNND